ncbi:hypothetical protein ACH82I_09605 [Brevibacterium sp. GP-SGM9]|uniref:hypothetical protein n=1 Tax=Brevibacterium sp. GP-SGM9 TaxID=3376990 RepID=UPI0039A50BFE
MFATANAALEFGRKIHRDGSAIFMFVSWTAAVLAICSVLQSSRPSELISEILYAFGADGPAEYFGLHAPPGIQFQSFYWQSLVLQVVGAMITLMGLYILLGGPLDIRQFEHRGNMMAISPWPNTVWLLFFAAVQIGPAPLLAGSVFTDWAFTAVKAFLGLLALTTLLALIGLKHWMSNLTSALISFLWTTVARIVYSVIFVTLSLMLVVAWLPLEIWTIVDRRQHIRDEESRIPSGAEPLDPN